MKKTKSVSKSKADNPELNENVKWKPDDFFVEIERRITDAENECSTWRTNQDKWHRMRMCIKKTKTFPFTGCANLRLPTVETKLRKAKSAIVKVIFGQRPIVQAIPTPAGNLQTASKIEKWVDHLIMDIMAIKRKAIIAIDQSMEKGMELMKPYWRTDITTRIEEYSLKDIDLQEAMWIFDPATPPEAITKELAMRLEVDMNPLVAEDNEKELRKVMNELLEAKHVFNGTDKIKCTLKDVQYNYPDTALASPEFVYVPADSKAFPQDCRMITHEFLLPYDEVRRNVELKNWSAEAVNNIEAAKTQDIFETTEYTKRIREGLDCLKNNSGMVKIWETYMYYDLNGDGFQEKCVFTFAPDFGQTFRKITLPYDNGKFPFVKFVNELTDDRWYSHRGIPEMIADLVREIDTVHNQKTDSMSLRNAPMISYRAGVVNPNLIKFAPAQAIPRHDPDDILMVNNTNLNSDFSYEKEQMILESKIEELVGQVDFSLQSMINRRQPRTAFEVSQQQSSMQTVFSLDVDLYTEAFSELFNMIWDLWCQYGSDQEEFSYFGENGWEQIRLSREEVQGKYKLILRGNDQNFNPQVRQERANQIMMATLNPVALQMGVVQPQNVYNSYKKFYQTLDVPNWQDFITDPQMLQQMNPPKPPPPPVKMTMDDMTPAEKAQVKGAYGIQPDIQGMYIKDQEDKAEKAHDISVDNHKKAMDEHSQLVELLKIRSANDKNNQRADTE